MRFSALARRPRAAPADPRVVDAVLDVLRSNPGTAAALRKADERAAVDRQRLAEQIAKIEAERDAETERLGAAEQDAEAAFRGAQAAFDAAALRWSRARADRHSATQGAQARIDQLRHHLAASAHPRILEIRRELGDLLDANRREPIMNQVVSRRMNPVTARYDERVVSNMPALRARVAAIVAAIEETERAKYEADQDAAVARLEALVAALPSPDQLIPIPDNGVALG